MNFQDCIPSLTMPPYEELEALNKKRAYFITVFDTPVNVYGRITLYEDGLPDVVFDVMEGGHCDNNRLSRRWKFNKTNYEELCRYANNVYQSFFRELLRTPDWIIDYNA